MPELPEVEAWRRQLDTDVKRSPIAQAGPAHIATLKTFDPPLSALEGEGLAGARRRAKRLFFPTDDGELVVLVHLITAGRLWVRARGREGAEDTDVPAAVRRRRRARAHRGREREARRRGAAPGRARAGVGTPRARGRRARRRGADGSSPPFAAPPRDAARPAADRRYRPRMGERDPARRAALAVRALDPVRRRRSTVSRPRCTTSSPTASSSVAGANHAKPSASTTGSGEPCPTAARRLPA